MKGKSWERIVRHHFGGMESKLGIRGRLIYLRPVDHILAGVDLNPSYNDVDRSDLEAFAMPLVVPREDVAYTVGERLSEVMLGLDAQELPQSMIAEIERGLDLAASWKSPGNFLQKRSWKKNKNELYVAEVEVYLRLCERRGEKRAEGHAAGTEAGTNTTDQLRAQSGGAFERDISTCVLKRCYGD